MIHTTEGLTSGLPYSPTCPAAGAAMAHPQTAPSRTNDVIALNAPTPLTDTEAQETLKSVETAVDTSPAEALSVHQGLDPRRVLALLAEL